MKKTFIFGLMAAALGFTACSSEDDAVLTENTQKGMVLNATVAQPSDTRATIDVTNASGWQFHFTDNDNISVTNSEVTSGTYYTFTKNGTTFESDDATPTGSAADWYAYYPSTTINLLNQAGNLESAASLYALAGKTATATTGADGLNIAMEPQVAIIKINNPDGISCSLLAFNPSDYTNVTELTANGEGYTVNYSSSAFDYNCKLISAKSGNPLYVVVPAGVTLTFEVAGYYQNNKTLVAGKYYEWTIVQDLGD